LTVRPNLASKQPRVVEVCNDDSLCNCDKTGEINCDGQDLNTANINPAKDLNSVTTLSMKSNKITALKFGQILMGKGDRLTSLILSENLIKTIEDNAFSDMSLLQTLDLRNNKLTYLSESTFAGLSSLIDIWLDHNLITDLSDGKIFAGSPKLQYLSMDWTPLKSVDNQTFDGLSNLIELSIDHGELSMLPEGTFKSLSNLKTLSMRHNQFRVIPQEELVWLKQLEHLDLSGNPIVTITSNAFRFNGHLHELLMSNMPDLNYVEDCAFCNLHELSTLQITNSSKFVDIDPEAFGRDQMYFQSLITVDLVNNSLTELDEDLLPWENITGMIRLGGNRWKCGCEALWMTNTALKYDSLDPPICATPLKLKGRQITSLDKYEPGLCLVSRLSGRIRAARVFLIAAILIIIFGLITGTWYVVNNRRKNGLKIRNLFYKPQLPKYAYRNLAMGDEADEVVIVSNDGASILPKSTNRKSDLASRLANASHDE
jgi:Leucine-rich repeat (LRR) protein